MQILVMAADLAAAGFPLPLQKGDRVVLQAADETPPAGEVLVLTRVDAQKRKLAGCIEAAARRATWLKNRRFEFESGLAAHARDLCSRSTTRA